MGSTSPRSVGRAAELASAWEVDGVADEWDLDSDARREAPPIKPVSFSATLPSASGPTAESCLERRFSLLKIDLKPLDEVGDVGDVGSADEGAVTVESRTGAVTSEACA